MLLEIGIVNNNEQDVFNSIIDFSKKYLTAYIPLTELYKYIYEYGVKSGRLLKSINSIISLIKKVYSNLYRKKYCFAEIKNDNVVALILLDCLIRQWNRDLPFLQKLRKEYTALDYDTAKPFPGSSYLPRNPGISRYVFKVLINDLDDSKYNEISEKSLVTNIFGP